MQLVADGGYFVTGLAIHAVIHPLQVPLWIDLTSVVVAALAGAAVAVEERFDLVGGILLAMVMGLGGGIIRDLLLGLRPVAVTNHYYLPIVTVAALAGYVFASLLRRFGTPFVVLDAMATGLFTVVGVEKALLYDLPDVSAIFIGVAAGVGGGLFVDLIAGRPVGMVHRGPWNATAALAGAAFYTVVAHLDAPTGFRQAAAFAVVVAMRLASLRWGLRDRKVVAELSSAPVLPFGLGDPAPEPGIEQLEPDDAVLLYTDGVTEARTPDGDQFGLDRLADLLEREAASGRAAEELLRRLVQSVLDHQTGDLRDDATLLLVQWTGP